MLCIENENNINREEQRVSNPCVITAQHTLQPA